MTDDMIELVARAIADAEGEKDWTCDPFGLFPALALAAIKAMREPTLEMRLTGRRVKSSWLVENEEIEIWQNMIDEAFK